MNITDIVLGQIYYVIVNRRSWRMITEEQGTKLPRAFNTRKEALAYAKDNQLSLDDYCIQKTIKN